MNMNTDKAIMLCQWKTTSWASNKWINIDKYQSSLNIIILNVRSNVLFSKFINVGLKLNYLPLNSNYNISTCMRCNLCYYDWSTSR